MGDRTYCTLYLKEEPSAELLKLIEDFGPSEVEDRQFSFEEVNYARLDERIEQHLQGNRISYAWVYESGYDYPAGVELFDGNTWASFVQADHSIMIPAQNASPEVVLNAQVWQTFFDSLT